MAWTTPRTWVAGEVVTAAIGNTHWRDNLNYLHDHSVALIGKITSAGGITSGTGFSVNKTGTGAYTVTFSPTLSAAPSISLTLESSGAVSIRATSVSTSSMAVETRNTSFSSVDAGFSFQAFIPI